MNTRQLASAIRLFEGTLQVLKTRESWMKELFAINRDGNAINVKSPEAVCFCLDGALRHALAKLRIGNEVHRISISELEATISNLYPSKGYYPSVVEFNDRSRTTFQDIKRVLRVTQQRLQRQLRKRTS